MMKDFGMRTKWQIYEGADSAGDRYTVHKSQLVFCPGYPLYDMFVLVSELGKDKHTISYSVRVHGSNEDIIGGEREVSSEKNILNAIVDWYKDDECGGLLMFCEILELIGCSGSIKKLDQEGDWIKYNNA
ncbi:MAG: hypothetical protein AABW49_04615 [Nanoarchaeota archaeon]|mgnify:CR=1 FL=1